MDWFGIQGYYIISWGGGGNDGTLEMFCAMQKGNKTEAISIMLPTLPDFLTFGIILKERLFACTMEGKATSCDGCILGICTRFVWSPNRIKPIERDPSFSWVGSRHLRITPGWHQAMSLFRGAFPGSSQGAGPDWPMGSLLTHNSMILCFYDHEGGLYWKPREKGSAAGWLETALVHHHKGGLHWHSC